MQILNLDRWRYLLRGAMRAYRQPQRCPCCGSAESAAVDRKLVYTLRQCAACAILYRFPYETAAEMADFYQQDYDEKGLTTELPSPAELERLKTSRFQGTTKDATYIIRALQALPLGPAPRVLDYGANWGYTAYQLQSAGFRMEAYELSRPRAEFGRNLGLDIQTNLDCVSRSFDAIYSGHVLEHVPDPRGTLRWMMENVRPGGFVVGHTPNGSELRKQRDFQHFHLHWGKVHPMLLSDAFLLKLFPDAPIYLDSRTDAEALRAWDGRSRLVGPVDGEELFFVIRRSDT